MHISDKTMLRIRVNLSLCLFIILGFFAPLHVGAVPDTVPYARNGVIDLTTWEPVRDGPVKLHGEWEFYWERLLAPEDFRGGTATARPSYLDLPRTWQGRSINGVILPGTGYATFCLRVRCADKPGMLGLKFSEILMAGKIWADGTLVDTVGAVGTGPAGMISQRRTALTFFKPREKDFDILVQVSNFHYIKGGIKGVIELGTRAQMQTARDRGIAFGLLLFGSLFIMALYHLGLFANRPEERTILYFGLFCLLFSLRSLHTGEIALTAFLPGLPWELMLRWEVLLVQFSALVALLLFRSMYPHDISRSVLKPAVIVCGTYIALTAIAPPVLVGRTLTSLYVLVAIILLYIIRGLAVAALEGKKDALLFLTGFSFVALTAFNDMLLSMDLVRTPQTIHFGFFFFILFLAYILSRRFSYALNTVEQQSLNLIHTNAAYLKEISDRKKAEEELKRYQDDLEGLVKSRTDDLVSTNEQLHLEIKERRRAEEELLKAGRLESLGIFAGGIAHDFNNILTAIMGNISMARMLKPGDTGLNDILTEAGKASSRARELTNQLLTFAKGGTPIKKLSSLRDVLTETAGFALSGSNVGIDYGFDPGLWNAEIDQGQIGQVIHNLVINAIQAMPGGGTITLKAENVTLDSTPFPLDRGNYVMISISDTGDGIPEEHIQKIFDPYFTTKPEGTGLGLAIAYSVIRKHEGHITASSVPGVGSTFTMYLPASEERVITAPVAMEAPRPTHGRVLVMDDDRNVIRVSSLMLRRMGMEPDEAGNGEEAVILYEKSMREGRPYDLVIMDLTVPGGMGGRETLEKIKELDPSVRAVVSSGYSNDPIMAHYGDYGFREVLAKPFEYQDLQRVVRKVLEERSR